LKKNIFFHNVESLNPRPDHFRINIGYALEQAMLTLLLTGTLGIQYRTMNDYEASRWETTTTTTNPSERIKLSSQSIQLTAAGVRLFWALYQPESIMWEKNVEPKPFC
jgi:hypothetical protein